MEIKRPSRLTRKVISLLRRHGIFTRLLLVFCSLLIASTFLITFFNQRSYTREIETRTGQYLFMLTKNASLKLRQEARRFEDSMTLFSRNEDVLHAVRIADSGEGEKKGAAQALIEKTLLSMKNRVGGIKSIVFVTEHGQYRLSAGLDNTRGAYIRNLDQLKKSEIYTRTVLANGYPVWLDSTSVTTELFYENEEDSLGIPGCVTLSGMVYEPGTRRPLGMLIYCIYPDFFADALPEYTGKDGSNTFVVGNGGMIEGIAPGFSGPPMVRQRAALMEHIFSFQEGSLSLSAEGQDLIASYCVAEGLPLAVVGLTYHDAILRTVRQIQYNNLAALAAIIAFGVLGFYFTAVSIEYPVKKLIRTMKLVGAGDLSATYKAESSDEIGELCREFDGMVGDMQALINRVYVSDINQKALQISKKNAQLDALQMQINPHFLYNTLDMIRWQSLAETGGESTASDMIEKFCALLRMTIKRDRDKETLAESLLHAATYLEVVNFRYRNKITLFTRIEFEAADYLIPCLVLQPIIENAVRHGFAGQDMDDCCVSICGQLTGGETLTLWISDNGGGMAAEQLAQLLAGLNDNSTAVESIGLCNVNQRCKLCYGEEYGICVESEAGLGTVVTLMIPAQRAGPREGERNV